MTDAFPFTVARPTARRAPARSRTPRGDIRTPAFMPVGTAGDGQGDVPGPGAALGADIILGNTYHLMLRPGAERVARLGGLHRFMRWPQPILTDSGGFQVMSLAELRKVDENGVTFQSHIDGSPHVLTPERSIEIQGLLGSDILMQLDECVALPCQRRGRGEAMRCSLRWAERCKQRLRRPQPGKALFGIVQGGPMRALRVEIAPNAWRSASRATPSAGWRSASRRTAMLRDARDRRAASAGRQAALPDGRRHARRHRRGGARAASTCSTA